MRYGRLLPLLCALFIAGLALLAVALPARAEAEAPDAAPDLIVELEIEPENPAPGDPIDIFVTVRNVGDQGTGVGFNLDIYYGRTATPGANEVGDTPYTVPALATGPGAFAIFSVEGIATANGACGWGVFARVDRGNAIAESDETNNFASLCAPPPCAADAFEADNSCSAAKWFMQGVTQNRTLCEQSAGVVDIDWIKFTAYEGITYTVGTQKPSGSDADPRVSILGACNRIPLKGPSNNSASFVAPHSGVYYAQVTRAGVAPLVTATYNLALEVDSGINDAYEPDNSCANARDITTDGVKQNHRFNKPNDEDWVKFSVPAGAAFTVVADGGTGGAVPVISIASSCANATSNQPPAEVSAAEANATENAEAMATITGNAATTTIYYVKARNQTGTLWGENVRYDLRVTTSACSTDSFEPDNAAAQARTLTLGAVQSGRVHCPAGDQDWVQFALTKDKTYVLETRTLGATADTVLSLFAPDKTTLLDENDDYGYTKGSRLVFTAEDSGTYHARIRHSNASSSGAGTAYSIVLLEGVCVPLGGDASGGDNGAGEATAITPNSAPVAQNFCADPLNNALGDQDWMKFSVTAGTQYQIKTTGLGSNSDTVLELYNAAGQMIQRTDDVGAGRATTLNFMPSAAGTVYVRVLQFNSNVLGDQSNYQIEVAATQPTTPTPTPTPTPIPPPPPTPANPASARTLIVVNRARIEELYGAAKADALMTKLFQLGDRAEVGGAVIQVETVPAIAAAYAAWTADANSLLDNDKANAVAEAIRAQLMTYIQGSDDAQYVVLVGDDRIIPFRRTLDLVVPPGNATTTEDKYATEVGVNTTVRAALAEKMILTDDYYVDKQPGTWRDKQRNVHELFLPDLAISRLIEDPNEIIAYINQYIANRTIQARRVLITGYDFVRDGAETIDGLYDNDTTGVPGAEIQSLISQGFTTQSFRELHLSKTPPFEIASINGHSTHKEILMPIAAQGHVTAAQIDAATGLAGTLVYAMGCHAGLNDPSLLDLPQAYMRRKATYVGNTGYGWGGGGTVYSEAMMRNFTRELLRDASAEVGPALTAAKLSYYARVQVFNAFDAKVLMQVTMYGLPMYQVISGAVFDNDDDFPSAQDDRTPPTSFGDTLATGGFGYDLNNSFGSFGSEPTAQGQQFSLDGNVSFEAGAPVQPIYYGTVHAPAAGTLRGVLFLGGSFSDTVGIDPVIALAENEYITNSNEPEYVAPGGWSPAMPFVARNSDDISPPPGIRIDSVALSLGQYEADAPAGTVLAAGGNGTQRLYDAMALSTLYSSSADQVAPTITAIDGVLNVAASLGTVKVEASDASGVVKVVIAYTVGANEWKSKEATFSAATQKWLAEIPATVGTTWFAQVVDGAGNVAVENNKGNNYPMLPPLPLATGAGGGVTVYLPMIDR